jgi:hypothetical protein
MPVMWPPAADGLFSSAQRSESRLLPQSPGGFLAILSHFTLARIHSSCHSPHRAPGHIVYINPKHFLSCFHSSSLMPSNENGKYLQTTRPRFHTCILAHPSIRYRRKWTLEPCRHGGGVRPTGTATRMRIRKHQFLSTMTKLGSKLPARLALTRTIISCHH